MLLITRRTFCSSVWTVWTDACIAVQCNVNNQKLNAQATARSTERLLLRNHWPLMKTVLAISGQKAKTSITPMLARLFTLLVVVYGWCNFEKRSDVLLLLDMHNSYNVERTGLTDLLNNIAKWPTIHQDNMQLMLLQHRENTEIVVPWTGENQNQMLMDMIKNCTNVEGSFNDNAGKLEFVRERLHYFSSSVRFRKVPQVLVSLVQNTVAYGGAGSDKDRYWNEERSRDQESNLTNSMVIWVQIEDFSDLRLARIVAGDWTACCLTNGSHLADRILHFVQYMGAHFCVYEPTNNQCEIDSLTYDCVVKADLQPRNFTDSDQCPDYCVIDCPNRSACINRLLGETHNSSSTSTQRHPPSKTGWILYFYLTLLFLLPVCAVSIMLYMRRKKKRDGSDRDDDDEPPRPPPTTSRHHDKRHHR